MRYFKTISKSAHYLRLMIRALFISFGLLFLVNLTYAQGSLTGHIYENKTKIPLAGITIENLKSHFTSLSDKNGVFSIRAHIGDLVTFSGLSYKTDTLYVKDLNFIEIFLDLKGNMLNEVKVTNQETRIGSLKAAPTLSPFGGQTLVYQTDESGNYTGGVTLNMFDSKSAANKKKRDARIAKDEDTRLKISRVFDAQNLQNYLPIKDQEMTNFIILYTPDVETFTNPEFNLTVYLNFSYKEFQKIPVEKRQSKEFLQLMNKTN